MRTRSLSTRSSCSSRFAGVAAVTAAAFALATLHPAIASADETEVSPTGKGIIGGALLGAEAVTIVESVAGVHSPLAYGVGAILGAGAGGVGGHFVENGSSDGRAPVYMLAVGVGLIIPALVLSLNGMRYQPSDTASEDHAPTNAPPANPGSPNGSSVTPATPAPMMTPSPGPAPAAPPPAATPAAPPAATPAPAGGGSTPPALSLLDMHGGAMRLGLPIPEVRQSYSMAELRQYGMSQQTEVRMPIVKIAF